MPLHGGVPHSPVYLAWTIRIYDLRQKDPQSGISISASSETLQCLIQGIVFVIAAVFSYGRVIGALLAYCGSITSLGRMAIFALMPFASHAILPFRIRKKAASLIPF